MYVCSIHHLISHIMYKTSITALVAVAALLLTACSHDEANSLAPQGRIVATINSTTTRTAVDIPADGAGCVGIVWTDGDRLGVFSSEGTAQKCYARVGTGSTAKATFAASGDAWAEPQYAYYPYSASNDGRDISSLQGTLPQVQVMDGGTLQGDYKYGRCQGTVDGGHEFTFTHLFALGRVVVDATGTPLQGERLKQVSLQVTRGTDPVAIAGDFTFSARNGVWQQNGDGASTVTLEWTDGVALGEPCTAYASLFPTVRNGDTFTVTVLTDSHRATLQAQCLTNFQRENVYGLPLTLDRYESLQVYDQDGTLVYPNEQVVTGTFTCTTLNVDGLPTLVNSDGPGKDGTTTLGNRANSQGWDFLAVSEDFEYHEQLASAMTNYDAGKYRGTVGLAQLTKKADTDGLCFFWKKGLTVTGETMVEYNDAEGGLKNGANTCIKKGFRHYVATLADGVDVDVYITHMNTYSGSGNTEESNAYVRAVLSQLRQLRDYVLANLKANKRPAIVMGDTNMRYTRHQVVDNLFTPMAQAGFQVIDPWVTFHRGGVFPTWNTRSLMTRCHFAGDAENDICCSDDQRGEVVDKVWYINHPQSSVQIEATSCQNDVEHFTKNTESVTYKNATTEDTDGTLHSGQTVTYTKNVGLADHFPVVVNFTYRYKRSK